jgi:5'-nucleotidase / UDP-sugar diphosphatase
MRVTFIPVNDIYLMADQMTPDGKRNGGFARLAAVVKAERRHTAGTDGEKHRRISPPAARRR